MRFQKRGEEIANSVIHGIAAALSIAALVVLVVFASKADDARRVTSLSIFGATLVLLYLTSTFYHSLTHLPAKRFFKLLDHSSIYFLIAGTYTPVVLVTMRGAWGWTLFGLIWAMALTGIIFKSLRVRKFKVFSTASYIAMGWLVVIAIRPLIEAAPPGLIGWLLAGGISYSAGIFFYRAKDLRYHHAVWHLFVLAGSVFHFFGLLFYVAMV